MSLTLLLDQTGTLHTPTAASVDADRNVTRTITDTATPYRLQQLSAAETDQAATAGATWRLFLPAGSPVKASSSFTDANGIRYSVIGTPDRVRAVGYEHHVEVLLSSAAGVDE